MSKSKEKFPESPEREARRLRDIIYGSKSSDKNWEECKENWIKDLEWLRRMTAKNK